MNAQVDALRGMPSQGTIIRLSVPQESAPRWWPTFRLRLAAYGYGVCRASAAPADRRAARMKRTIQVTGSGRRAADLSNGIPKRISDLGGEPKLLQKTLGEEERVH